MIVDGRNYAADRESYSEPLGAFYGARRGKIFTASFFPKTGSHFLACVLTKNTWQVLNAPAM